MGKYNTSTQKKVPDTVNLAGEDAYSFSDEMKLATLVLTSKMEDQFYRSNNDTITELRRLISILPPEYTAKAAVYARNKFGLRSISHVVAGEVAKRVKGAHWTQDFFKSVVRRVDDMYEVLGYYSHINNKKLKPIPNSVKKGFRTAFGKFDEYQLSKYKAEGKEVNLKDLVNILHPKPTEKNMIALAKLIKEDTLKSTKTWEAKSSAVGMTENEEKKAEAKKEVWSGMTKTKNRPYLETIRNINNVLTNSPESLDDLCTQITNKEAIHKSLVMPSQIVKAYENSKALSKTTLTSKQVDQLVGALNQAFKHSTDNVELPEGETLVALDSSGSMQSCFEEAAPLAVAIATARSGDMVMFDSRCVDADSIRRMEPMQAIEWLKSKFNGGSTDFGCVFRHIEKKYENIVFISDMQSWASGGASGDTFELRNYEKKAGAKAKVFLIDIQGYGTSSFPVERVATTAGFSRQTLALLGKLIEDPKALINEIKAVKFE